MRRLEVKTKLILALGLILMVSFVVTSIINYRLSRESIRREIMTSSLPLTSENIYSQIHTDLLKPINVSSLMANDTFLRDWALDGEQKTDKVVDYLAAIQSRYGYFASFFVSSISGNYYYPGGILKQVSEQDDHDIWFYSFLNTGKEYALDVDTNEAEDNNLTIFVNFRLEDAEGKLLGVTGVGLEMDRVAKLLKHYQRTYDRSIYLVNHEGVIQAHTEKEKVESESMAAWQGLGPSLEYILTPREFPKQFEFDSEGRHMLLSVRYIPEFDWFLVVEQDELSALKTARSNLIRTLLVGFCASIIIIILTVIAINHYQKRLERLASTDELTGTANRREFDKQFERSVHRRSRYGMDFSVLLIDIDGLKTVNDTHGHLAGDQVIKGVANIIRDAVRTGDIVARWGGDEFIVLVEGASEQAGEVAERIRLAVEEASLCDLPNKGKCAPVSVCLGVTEYRDADDLDSVTMRADKAMYTAKNEGKNAVRIS